MRMSICLFWMGSICTSKALGSVYKGCGILTTKKGVEIPYTSEVNTSQTGNVFNIAVTMKWQSSSGHAVVSQSYLSHVFHNQKKFDVTVAGQKTGNGTCYEIDRGKLCNANYVYDNQSVTYGYFYDRDTSKISRTGTFFINGEPNDFTETLDKIAE